MTNMKVRSLKTGPVPSLRSLALVAVLASQLLGSAAHADPPATVASCEGIKNAYQVLGTVCAKQYEKISHAPATSEERKTSYAARIAVIEIFRKALLCNGMYNASSALQSSFKSEEGGHLVAIANLHQAMVNAGDPSLPALYTESDLKKVAISKQQCK